jgi:molybdate transport system substrate-binding protein
MTFMVRGISSMATRLVLGAIAGDYETCARRRVYIESVGGVDAAKRIQAGEDFDFVVLASDAIDKLVDSGKAIAGTKVDLVRSSVAIAVRKGAVHPAIDTEEALKQTILAAPTIGYSTGPSGVALVALFERWGIAGELRSRIVQAPPGVPVGSLVAEGKVALGFQQLSELIHLEGIDIVGPMPQPVGIVTTFSGAACTVTDQVDVVRDLLRFMAAPESVPFIVREGMEPANPPEPAETEEPK